MKTIIFAAITALSLGLTSVGHAQVTSGSSSGAGAAAIAYGATNIIVPGSGPAAQAAIQYSNLGTLANPQALVGQTTGGNAVTSYDACNGAYNYTLGPGSVSGTKEIKRCWSMREAEFMAKNPPGTWGYEHQCNNSDEFLNTDWSTGTIACTLNQAKLAKSKPNDPRLQAKPVVVASVIQPSAVPAERIAGPLPAVDYSRPCNPRAGIVEQCTQR